MEKMVVVRRAQLTRALRIVPYLTGEEVEALAREARKRRKGGAGCSPYFGFVSNRT